MSDLLYVVSHECGCVSRLVMIDDQSEEDVRRHADVLARVNRKDPLVRSYARREWDERVHCSSHPHGRFAVERTGGAS